MKKIIVALFLVLGLCFNLYALDLFQPDYKDAVASDFTLQDLSGNSVSLSDFKDKPIILFFWTTWCPNCRREIFRLNQEYKSLRSEGVELLAIDIGESKSRIESFTKNYSIEYPVFLDSDSSVAYKYGILGVPTIILINKEGNIASVSHTFPEDYKKLLVE